MSDIKIGLLPLYAGLYDQMDPQDKHTYSGYIDEVADGFAKNGASVVKAPVGIYESDIRETVRNFEKADVSLIAVLFLAYHPSLESAPALSETKIPVAMLDITPSLGFGPNTDPSLIMPCHGIHGVQDLCCVLQRYGKPFRVFAGHSKESDAIARCACYAKSCAMAAAFKSCRVGIIGEPFEKMGDFAMGFPYIELTTGAKTISLEKQNAIRLTESLTEAEINEAAEMLRSAFSIADGLSDDCFNLAATNTAVIKKWIHEEKLNAFTFNFLDFGKGLGLSAIPFAAASLLMGGCTGYAGEGDVLTAALVAACMRIYPESTFTEMFCPDWQGNTVFMSHMGEVNYKVSINPTIFCKDVPWVPELNGGKTPGVAALYKPGDAVLVNLVPLARGKYSLILAPCEICAVNTEDKFIESVRGWLRPPYDISKFLEDYSNLGGTHHSSLCYGADVSVLAEFGKLMGWKVHILEGK